MERGQVTIEMIFIMGVFMLLLFSVSIPSVLEGGRYSKEVQFTSDAKFANERLATALGMLSNPYEKRSIEIYMPGHDSPFNSSDNKPVVWMGMCTEASGSVLNTTVAMVRRQADGTVIMQETYSFTRDLGAGNWKIYINTSSGYQEGVLVESAGRMYNFTLSWENITSNTVPSYVLANCSNILSLGGI
jgi:hypothetical protein